MHTNRTLTVQESDQHRDAVPRRNAQQHVNVVRRRFAFHQIDFLLTTQILQYLAQILSESPIMNLDRLPPTVKVPTQTGARGWSRF